MELESADISYKIKKWEKERKLSAIFPTRKSPSQRRAGGVGNMEIESAIFPTK